MASRKGRKYETRGNANSRRNSVTKLGLQRLKALPSACEACVWALLLVALSCGSGTWYSIQSLLPPTCPVAPSPCTHTLSPPSATRSSPFPQRTWSFLSPDHCAGCSLNRNAHPLLYLEDAVAPCPSYTEAIQDIAGSQLLFPWSPAAPWASFSLRSAVLPSLYAVQHFLLSMQCSTYHTGLMARFPVCLAPPAPYPQLLSPPDNQLGAT